MLLTRSKTPWSGACNKTSERANVGRWQQGRNFAGLCLSWLAVAFGSPYPRAHAHFAEFFQMGSSGNDNRGSLKCSHRALVLMEEVAGVSEESRVTNNPLYMIMYKEVLATVIARATPSSSASFSHCSLGTLEDLMMDYRIHCWWIVLQCHPRLKLKDCEVSSLASFIGKLTGSKTSGED